MDFNHLPYGYKKYLPCSTPPLPEELLSSWLVRTAHLHCLKIQTFTKIIWPNFEFWTRDIDLNPNPMLLKSLSEMTASSSEQIWNTTLRSYKNVLFDTEATRTAGCPWIIPLNKYHRIVKNRAMLFCPSCFQKDGQSPYYRKQWRLALSTCCPNCNVRLLDCCPQCHAPIIFYRNELGHKSNFSEKPISYCYRCNADLSAAPKEAPSILESNNQKELYRIMNEGYNSCTIYPNLYFSVLHFIVKLISGCSPISKRVRESICSQTCIEDKYPYLNSKLRFECLNLKERRWLLTSARWLLEEWPNRFVDFFKSQKVYSSFLLRDFHDVPFWYYSIVIEHLYVTNQNRVYFLRLK